MRAGAVALLVAAAVSLTACGPSTDGGAGDALDKTANNLARIHSGELAMTFTLAPAAAPRAGRVGVALKGPFALQTRGGLPLLDVTYQRIAGPTTTSARLVSTGRAAYVVTGGSVVQLSAQQTAPLLLGRHQRTLGDMGFDATGWVRDARLRPGPSIGGARTDVISGKLDVTAATRDFVRAARRSGADLSKADRQRIADAVTDSSVQVLTGHDDRLLRSVSVQVTLDLPPSLRAATGGRARVKARFAMAVAHPNARVRIRPPN